jgi:PAS domain S-box-containing protein
VRRRRRAILTVISALGLAGSTLLLSVSETPGEPGGMLLFAPFVALLAFEYGALAGAANGAVAVGLYALALEVAGGDARSSHVLMRLLPMLVLGSAIGWLNERLQAQQARYRQIVETSADLICTIDPRSTITFANPRVRDILGYEPEEVIGQPVSLVVGEQEAQAVAQRLAARQQGLAETQSYDIRLKRKDGTEVWALVNSSPFYDARGTFAGALAIVSDISDRRRMEQDLRERERLLEDAQAIAHIGSWEWDIMSNRVTWSEELYRIYGLDPAEFEASYEAFVAYVHPDDRQLVNEAVQEAYAFGKPFRFEHRVVRPDGEIRYLEARGMVFRDGGARPTRMSGTGHDITDRRLAEEALVTARLARRQARELNDNVVQGIVLAKYALDRGDAATAATMVESTLTEARRMIHDLLGEAEVEPGHLRREAAAGVGE